MNEGKLRIIGGLLIGSIVLTVCFSSLLIQVLFLLILASLCTMEILSQMGYPRVMSVVYLIPFSLLLKHDIFDISLLSFCTICFLCILLLYIMFYRRDSYSKQLILFSLVIYPVLCLAALSLLILTYNSTPHLLILLVLQVWSADIGAYYVGKRFGRNKIAPSLSPGKSWEGFLGGGATVLLVSLLFNWFSLHLTIGSAFLIAIVVWITAFLGDLLESSFKRFLQIKDSGNIIPGHGGIFDRFDAFIFAAPFYSLLIYFIL